MAPPTKEALMSKYLFERPDPRANAMLTVAAPDLFEALFDLVEIVEAVRVGERVIDTFTLQPARAALRKAKLGTLPRDRGPR